MASDLSSRRLFLATAAAAPAALADTKTDLRNLRDRAREAYQIRVDAARAQRDAPLAEQKTNGDEELYPNKIGSYHKGLPHDARGDVDTLAYSKFVAALDSGKQSELDRVPMGSADPLQQRKFVNPCAGLCFELAGADPFHLTMPPAPAVASAEAAGEMVELYWMALTRDVPFTEYATNALTQAAAAELSKLKDFRGPKAGGAVTPATLFRGFTAGDVAGPYISQFLLKPVPFGAQYVEQRMRTLRPGVDYLTTFAEWLAAQNGTAPSRNAQFDGTRRYIRNGRDLSQWVHIDVLYQAYFNAMLIMVQPPDPGDELIGGGIGAPLNPGNPYAKSATQEGFGTFGGPAIATAVAAISTNALKAVWRQKWFAHRRQRPEAYGGLVHVARTNPQSGYPLDSDVLNSQAVSMINSRNGTALLPMAFPEGSPLHPSYGAGHATVAGASVTILKALFDESYVIPNPVAPSADGLTLVPYSGPPLTVGGELNKLASNIGVGRNIAGVHWRSDYVESLKLGEAIAISVLQDQARTYAEQFNGFTFTKFNGTKVTV